MSFTIITTLSPEFERARTDFIPTWEANAGADEIIVHEIDEGTWVGNIVKRAEVLVDELLTRLPRGEKVLALDADCLVLRDLSGGFSDDHMMSVARWPNVNLGVVFYNLAVEYKWRRWLCDTVDLIREEGKKDHKPSHELDQAVWRPRLHEIDDRIFKLAEHEWNYNTFPLDYWKIELPQLVDITRVLHIKGHGDWNFSDLDRKLAYAKTLWPKELACITSA